MRFIGNIEAKVDAKGRAFLPAAFRKVLQESGEESLVLRKDIFEPCLVLYPESAWNRQLDMLRQKLNRWDGKKQAMFRQFVIDAELITLDSNGRMLIPKRHLKLAEIEQDVRFIGMDDTIEIWSTKNTEQPFINPEDFKQWREEVMEDGQGHLQ